MGPWGGLSLPFLLSPEENVLLLNQRSTEVCVPLVLSVPNKTLVKVLRNTDGRCNGKKISESEGCLGDDIGKLPEEKFGTFLIFSTVSCSCAND